MESGHRHGCVEVLKKIAYESFHYYNHVFHVDVVVVVDSSVGCRNHFVDNRQNHCVGSGCVDGDHHHRHLRDDFSDDGDGDYDDGLKNFHYAEILTIR